MFVRIRFASSSGWGRRSLVLALGVVPVFMSCATTEDTEPFVPAVEGATQPDEAGALISEEDACDRLRSAALDAYDRLGCDAPTYPACPGFLRPGGGSGCYEYRADSVDSCEQAYEEARSCRTLSPCLATAELNVDLPTCDQPTMEGGGGAGGGGSGGSGSGAESGGSDAGGMGPLIEGGSPSTAGQPAQAGAAGDSSNGGAG